MVAVHRQHRENADELDALLQLGLQAAVADGIVVGGQRQHAAGQAVHQVLAGGFHDNVADEVGGQVAAFGQHTGEIGQLGGGGQIAHQQQVSGLLKAIALAAQAADEIIDIVAAVPQLAFAGDLFAVALLKGVDAGNVGDAGQNALAVLVAQAALDAQLIKQRRVDAVALLAQFGIDPGFLFNGSVLAHGLDLRSVSIAPHTAGATRFSEYKKIQKGPFGVSSAFLC